MENLLHDDERLDDLQINGYKIIQHPDKFCFGMDAVLLSGFAKVKDGEKALDLGTGTGILPILLEAKTEGEHFSGLEIQTESVEMANRSVRLNHLEEKIDIIEGDIKNASEIFGKASMDVVTSNPPYMTNHNGLKNPNDAKAIARHELLCSLEDVVRETAAVLKPRGRCYFVHRPSRLVEIFEQMRKYKIEPKRIRLVYPYVNKEPNMVLVEGVRGGGAQLTVESPLIVYDAPGKYTDEIYEIYNLDKEDN
ncbi:MAG: tRNA1(Val) (adenine(37)-N6)-methyltransferase [Pseudobutyrivibrio sp.]|nr:tRNA1(Val) (adenine(37)-N6)-methyltransferase [Pseudobutyrivibrio sp.]